MIYISWKAYRLKNEQTQNALANHCSTHKPDWLGILEPKIRSSLPQNYLKKLKLNLLIKNSRQNSRLNIWVFCRQDLANIGCYPCHF